jgi:hypothetical protein
VESHDIRCKMVVFPAFALPITRIRNLIFWGTRGRIVLLLVLADDLELACLILGRCEKETCQGGERVCDCKEIRHQIEPIYPPVDGRYAGKHQLTTA